MKDPLDWLKQELGAPEAGGLEGESEILFVPVPGGETRVLHHRPPGARGRPVVVIPGFGATIAGWDSCYGRVLGRAEILVVETLEKGTTRLGEDPSALDLSIQGSARQVAAVLDQLGLVGQDHVLLGSCWGGAVLLEGMLSGVLDPPTAVAYDPMGSVFVPPVLLRHVSPMLPSAVLGWARRPIRWWLLRKMTEPTQRRRVESFVDAADPFRWKSAAEAMAGFHLPGRLHALEREVLVVGGSHDFLHDSETLPALAAELPHGRLLRLPVEESQREHMTATVIRALAAARAEDGVPPALRPFEQDLGPLRQGLAAR